MKKLVITGLSTLAFLLFITPSMLAGGSNDTPPTVVNLGTVSEAVVKLAKPAEDVLFSNCQDEIFAAIDEDNYSPLFIDEEYDPTWGRGYFMYAEVRAIGNVEFYCAGTCFENAANGNLPATTHAQECGVLMTESTTASFGSNLGLTITQLTVPTNTKFSVKIQVCSGCADCDGLNSGDDILWWEATRTFETRSEFIGDNVFNLTYQGSIGCNMTLDCSNWP